MLTYTVVSSAAGNRKRECKTGAGFEQNSGACDTPGFVLRDEPAIVLTKKKYQKLEMARNHTRLSQCSEDLLQSWRGNCDIQVLIYRADAETIDAADIARVTDYIVAYACKGNVTTKEEKLQNKKLILASADETGDKSDVMRVARRIINRSASNRLITKQECMVLLGKLDLVLCSEKIQCVPLGGGQQVSVEKGDAKTRNGTIVGMYMKRDKTEESLSLYRFFHRVKNDGKAQSDVAVIVPHFVGLNGQPIYPVTDSYARAALIIYKPWRDTKEHAYYSKRAWQSEFAEFLHSDECPSTVQIDYERVYHRWVDHMTSYQAVAGQVDHSNNPISDKDQELLDCLGMHAQSADDVMDHSIIRDCDRGVGFDWSVHQVTVSYSSLPG